MARRDAATHIQFSVWDRLTNPDLGRAEGPGLVAPNAAEKTGDAPTEVAIPAAEDTRSGHGSADLNRLLEGVRRDLEWLLNSRRAPLTIPKGMTHLNQSVVAFGLPDFTGKSFSQTQEREELVAQIEALIRDFEPRLTDVRVAFHRVDLRKAQAALHYRIEALLKLDPGPEPVAFDTVLNVGDRAFRVTPDGG